MSQATAKRTSLLIGCGSAALALGLILGPAPAQAQGIQAGGNVTFGGANIDQTVPDQTTVDVFSRSVVIDWTPQEDAAGNALDFLPDGNTAFYRNNPNASITGPYAVLNRILPSTNGNVAVINGSVISQIIDFNGGATSGGFIAFYSPTGILVGSTASFDVGQLLLTTLDTTPDDFDQFAQSGFGLQLRGAQGSTARISIAPGAQILASPENAFFAVVAADVEMRGVARVNGSHVYVAGEAVNLSFDNGLFSIQVPVGTAASGEVVTLDGTVGGPSSTGFNGDNHLIYAVARASQDPISMLLRGNLGFDTAQSAGIVNGEIILAANYNVFGRSVDGGSIDQGIDAQFNNNSELSTTRADIFLEDFAASSSLLAIGTHRTQVTARTTASSVLGNLLMVGRQNAELTASNGQNFTISGDVLVSAQDYGVSGSGLQSLDVLNAAAGTAFIDAFGGGTMTISGSALVAADAFAGAETSGGPVGSATGGQALIGSTGGSLRILGDATATARGVGSTAFNPGTGATSRGGLAQFFSVQGGNVTLDGSLVLDASATGAGSDFGTSTASNAFGGNAFLNIFNGAGSITIGNGATLRANATGGDASTASGAGIGDAGVAIADVNGTGSIDITGNLTLEATGIGGNNGDATGGAGLGGRATSTIDAGGQIIVRGDFSADASGRGGDGVNGGDGLGGIAGGIANIGFLAITGSGFATASGAGGSATFEFGGNGGIGRGGNAAFQAGGTLTQTARVAIDGDATVLADGTGGDGGQAFDQTTSPAGRGGDGFGGDFGVPNQADPAFGSGAFLLAGGDNGSIAVGGSAFVSAGATGGRGGAGDFVFSGGQGGNAAGGLAQVGLALLGQNGSVGLGVADFGDVVVNAGAMGGGGGLTSDTPTGNGGTGTGGVAAATVRAGDVSADSLTLIATGFGGSGAVGGTGTGGEAAVLGSLGGTLVATGLTLEADGFGGFSILGMGGDGIGGVAEMEIDGTTITINGDLAIEANGAGGDSADGAGGNGLGGEAYIGQVGVGSPGVLNVTGHTALFANGRGGDSFTGFAAGNGEGGHAWIRSSAGATKTFGSVQLTAVGAGGQAATHEGGNGTGGLVELISTGTGSRITIARNTPAAFASDSPGGVAMLNADGIGEQANGGDGVGGFGQGGTILVSAALGGAVNLPVNILADPDRAADVLLLSADGTGGDSAVDGGSGGAGGGGAVDLLVEGGTVTMGQMSLGVVSRGGNGAVSTSNIRGGDAFGGSSRIMVNGGSLTTESASVSVGAIGGSGAGTSDGGLANAGNVEIFVTAGGVLTGQLETSVGARGGSALGTGDGGDARVGSNRVSIIRGTLNVVNSLSVFNSAQGGDGTVGGDAFSDGEGGGAFFTADEATIGFTPSGFASDGIFISTQLSGGTGIVQGGAAQGGFIGATITDSTITGRPRFNVRSDVRGGAVSGPSGTGGLARSDNVRVDILRSNLALSGETFFTSLAEGGGALAGIGATGGAAVAGAVDVSLTDSTLDIALGFGGVGTLQVLSVAFGGGADTVGAATARRASLLVNSSDLSVDSIEINTAGRTNSFSPPPGQVGGVAQSDIALLDVRGDSTITARALELFASAATSTNGTAIAGEAVLRIVSGSTAVINANDMLLRARGFGSADPANNIAGRFDLQLNGGTINAGNFVAQALGEPSQSLAPSQLVANGGSLLASGSLFAESRGDIDVITGQGGIIGSSALAQVATTIQIETAGTLSIFGIVPSVGGTQSLSGATGGIRGQSVNLLAGRSIFLDGNVTATDGGITLIANRGGGAPMAQPPRSEITLAQGALIDGGTGTVSIILEDGFSDPQRQTGAITLANITARSISARNFGVVPGSDIIVRADGVLTASGTGRAIDLASLNGEVINLHGDAGLILTGGGHFGIFAATPTGSQIGSPANYARRYNVLTEGAYDALNPGGNFAAFRISPVLTVTIDDIARFYGSANPAFTTSIAGFLTGDSIADITGAAQFSTLANGASPIGQYAINASLGSLLSAQGYQFSFAPGILTITARPITITANSFSRIYGNANPALGFVVGGQGLVNGDQLSGTLATTAGLTSGVGSYGITQGSLAASANYAVTFVGGQLTVTPRPIIIDANSFSRIYGNANPALTFSLGGQGLVNGDQLTGALATAAGVTTGVGTFAITQGTLTAGANYTVTYNAGALTITPRPITITADSFSRIYGNANPALTFGIGGLGLVNGDQLSGALAAAGVTAGVGTSAITQGTLSAGANYAVTYNAGILTITPRPITITANSFSRVYGNANPALTFSIGGLGLVNGDQLTGALATLAGVTTGVGTAAITIGTLAASSNYTLAFTPGVLTITPRPLTVAADNLSKSLGLSDPLLTFSITAGDLVNGDLLSGSLVRDPGEGVASFVIRQGTLAAGSNYALTFVPGTFTINPPPVSPDLNNPTSFVPPLVIDNTPPPIAGEEDGRFGIDFPELPDAPLISEDPLLDDPVASGGDSSLYGSGGGGAASPTTTGGQ